MFWAITLLLVLSLSLGTSGLRDCFEHNRNYIILFDTANSVDDQWSLVQFIGSFGKRIRKHNPKNRLAIGTFEELKLPMADSEFRTGYAFQQAVMDLKLMTVDTPIKKAVEKARQLADAEDPKTPLMVIFVVTSKGKSDAEHKENIEAAKNFYKGRKVSGFTVGVGDALHPETLRALSGQTNDDNVFIHPEFIGLDNVDNNLAQLICEAE